MLTIEPVAIIGIGCRFPGGVKSADDLWELLREGRDAIIDIPSDRWHVPAVYHPDPAKPGRMIARQGGFIDQIDHFDSEFFGISPREAARADPQQRLMLQVAYQAVEDAGLTMNSLAGRRAGVYVGISTWDYSFLQSKSEERSSIDAYGNVGTALCISANRISYFFNLVGPSLAVDTACSSSLVATHLACRGLWNGETELAFVGGVNLLVQPDVTIGFSKASMLSPDSRCKSFDSRANGYVRSEGAGIIILKPLKRALVDGDKIYAVIRATAVNQDGRTPGISVPSQASQESNIVDALRLAEISPETIQYVEAHGTGTPVGDPIEAAAIGATYGRSRDRAERCVVGSIKSNFGHLEAAAGMAGLIKAALCLWHRIIPANLHFEKPNPNIPFDELQLSVSQRLQPWPETHGLPPRAGVNSFGFGGTNGHVILEAAPELRLLVPRSSPTSAERRAWMLPLSARSSAALRDFARSYIEVLQPGGSLADESLRDICFSASVKRSHHDLRLAVVAHDHAEMVEQLGAYLQGEERANSSSGRVQQMASRPVFVCSGMGQQWWAMGRELLSDEPVFRRAVEEVSELFASLADWSLLKKLMADEKSSQLRETRFGQPAIFAVQVGLAKLWRSWGIEPAAVLGHSAGEMAATFIAGVLSLEDAVRVTFHRSRLQSRAAGQGIMLAAGISEVEAKRLVAQHPREISIAAVNGTGSVTLSGDAAVLSEVAKALNAGDTFCRPLQVDVPFHSPKMELLERELRENLRDIRPRPATTPFFSAVTGTKLSGAEVDAGYWYRNVRDPVLFQRTMHSVIAAGHHVFLEISAHPVLRRDIEGCLNEKVAQGLVLTSLRREERERAAMLGTLGRFYTAGADIEWRRAFPEVTTSIKLPTYPFQPDRHWRESSENRRVRTGRWDHPLLGVRLGVAKPSWNSDLVSTELDWLADHVIAGSVVFPGAGYVEMALAAAREVHGTGSCLLEEVEFQKFLVLDQSLQLTVQTELDLTSGEFSVHVRSDPENATWDKHARIRVNGTAPSARPRLDLATIQQRCKNEYDREECQRRFAIAGFHYGPAFQGMERLWCGDREDLGEVRVQKELLPHLADYRLHPAVLDACFQPIFALFPLWNSGKGMNVEIFVPVKIDRVVFYAPLPERMFAYMRLVHLIPTEIKVDLQIVDESGLCLAEVSGLTARQAAQRPQRLSNAFYEYQWQLASRELPRSARDSHHLPSPKELAAVLEAEGEKLQRRLQRGEFQEAFQRRSRTIVAAYVVRALRDSGWTPDQSAQAVEALLTRLEVAPHHRRWVAVMLKMLTQQELTSTENPFALWKEVWNDFPDCQTELRYMRLCGEKLGSVLRGEVEPELVSPDGLSIDAQPLYQDAPTVRLVNLLVQSAVNELARRLPQGKLLRILEVGGGAGGTSSFVLPMLQARCTEYIFTDPSELFTANARLKFAQRYPFVQFRKLDLDQGPLEQSLVLHSFDLIIASGGLSGSKDLRKALEHLQQLLGFAGLLISVEITQPWLYMMLIYGLLERWWASEDDLRDGPFIPQESWGIRLNDAGFGEVELLADCQHSLILARRPQLTGSSELAPSSNEGSKVWLLFSDVGADGRASSGNELALRLRQRGDTVFEVTPSTQYLQSNDVHYCVRPGDPDDMRRVLEAVAARAPHLAGIVHLWSLDIETSEEMMSDALVASARLNSVGVLQLIQALGATEALAADSVWLVTRSAQPLEGRVGTLQVAQSPLWGLGRVAINEYRNQRCRLVDLGTGSREEIESLVQEFAAVDSSEDEIALHGELRYVRRLVPISPASVKGIECPTADTPQPFRFEVERPGILDTLKARPLVRCRPGPREVEIEVAAASLNFMDLMLVMGMLPAEAIADRPDGSLPGLECAGRVVAVGDHVTEFAVGDAVVAGGTGTLGTHVTADVRVVARKPAALSFEKAAQIPITFLTVHHSLNNLAQIQPGERVLIHSGTGGVGLVAIQMALKAGGIVFATAGSPAKRALLTALGVPYVMDSRTLAFAEEVMKLTDGEGVDIVLNSLSGEAIDKSFSVLRAGGRFIEIGKSDIYANRKIGMRALRKNVSVFVVDLLGIVDQRPAFASNMFREMMTRFDGVDLRPIAYRVYPAGRVVDAFRDMAQAKHVGKLIVSMQDSAGVSIESNRRAPAAISADASYLITGGLGGFGLAIADHLVRNGARRLALVGRSAPSTTAQTVIEKQRRSGAEVRVFLADVTDREQISRVIETTRRELGLLRGIIHAAMALDDAAMERLNEERMWAAMAPKILGAWHLHTLTAGMPLDFFVLFSSIAATVGNPGQANYVAGNAFLDALAHYRRGRGLPALTVSWGVLGDVGHVARSPETAQKLDRLGLRPMPLSESLDALDELMSGGAVQVAVAQVEWKNLLRQMGSAIAGKYSKLVNESRTEEGRSTKGSGVRDILEADDAALPTLVEGYIRDVVARAMRTSPTRIDIQQSLTSLGLDSLIAMDMRNRVQTDLGLNIPLSKLMGSGSLADLVAFVAERLIDKGRGERPVSTASERPASTADEAAPMAEPARPALGPAARPAEIPLSFGQRRLWFINRLEGPSATYTIPMGVRLKGTLDREAFEAALGDVVGRHESLRTIFPDTLGVPRQQILEASAARPRLAVASVSEDGLAAALTAAARQTFDIASELPLRAHLFVLDEREHVLLLLLHHIAGDGWSMAPLVRDLATAYATRCRGVAPDFAPLPVQYADYTLWHTSVLGEEGDPESVISRQLAYWTERLQGLPDQLDLPLDRPRPAVSSYRGDSVPLNLPAALHAGLLALARDSNASLFMVLQAALAALLTRLGAGTDIPIGSPIAGRTDSALDDLVGFFVNTLVLRTDTSGNPSFRELLARVRTSNLSAYSNQDLPFERLVEVINPARSLSRHPLFQVMLALQNNAPVKVEGLPGDLTVVLEPIDTASAKFDLSISLMEQHGADGRPMEMVGNLEYAVDLFDRSSVEVLAGRLVRLLGAAVAEPDRALGSLDILSAEERHTILREWNDTAHAIPSATLPQLFAAQVDESPDAIAVVFADHNLTYGELDARANQLAHHLRDLGVGAETVVGLCVERSPEMIVGLLGILKAGGAYLPLDPDYPQDRLAFMLADAGAPVLVTQSALLDRLGAHGTHIVRLDADWPTIAQHSTTAPAIALDPHNPAYVIYTSGSTGTRKASPLAMRRHTLVCSAPQERSLRVSADRHASFSLRRRALMRRFGSVVPLLVRVRPSSCTAAQSTISLARAGCVGSKVTHAIAATDGGCDAAGEAAV